ncbi:MAG: lyase family protein [Planctomycetota bacterium]
MSDGPASGGRSRTVRDALGSVQVPADARYGAGTARAAAWSVSSLRMPLPVVHALGHLKGAAARAHGDAGRLPATVSAVIEQAAAEVAAGRHDEQFVVDVFQTGSGTSSHMNANEVIAHRANELLGDGADGAVHPNDHVNLAMSSNDVMPSAAQLAAVLAVERQLWPALDRLGEALHALADRHWDDVRTGRTHLMAAVPIRFGQQFRGHAELLGRARARLSRSTDGCRALPLGGTAVGTGVNCPPGFAAATCRALAGATGVRVHETSEHLAAAGSLDLLAALVADLRGLATALGKVADDVRWQASSALREVELPALQPGSSIMPGKQNPVVCEAVLMVCAQVVGNDAAVAFAATQGRFELNTMLPVIAHNAIQAIELLAGAAARFASHCLEGLRLGADAGRGVDRDPMLATALAPVLGYDRAAALAKLAAREGRAVLDVARAETDLPAERLAELLDPRRLCGEFGRQRRREPPPA